jgi:hypothetical protein
VRASACPGAAFVRRALHIETIIFGNGLDWLFKPSWTSGVNTNSIQIHYRDQLLNDRANLRLNHPDLPPGIGFILHLVSN